MSWSAAYDDCSSRGATNGFNGRLLTQIDDEQWNFVTTSFSGQIGGSNSQRWIGVVKGAPNNDVMSNVFWVLSPKTDLTTTSVTLPTGVAPTLDSPTEMCIRAVSGTSWNDIDCSTTYGYICEYMDTTPLPSCNYGCPTGYFEWVPGKCYRTTTNSGSWTQCVTDCTSDGGNLVVINNDRENAAIMTQAAQDIWIGCSDASNEGVYMNTDGSAQIYLPWQSGEPNGGTNENCENMWGYNGRWNDQDCGDNYNGVCQSNCGIAPTPCQYGCQTGYTEWYPGTCYKYVSTSMLASLAVTTCLADVASLVVVEHPAEQLAVQSHISGPVWLGIQYQITSNNWQSLQGAITYTNWHPPAPPGGLGQLMTCAYIDPANSYQWSTASCLTDSKQVVCEAKCLLTPLPGACSANPCVHGNCTNGQLLGQFTCSCPAGYTGTTCDADINECDSNPCQNDGVCTQGFDSYNCTCLAAFSGTNCEVKLTTCDIQTSAEQTQRVAMFASQSVSSITLLVLIGIVIIIFLILREFSLERVLHMGQEISIWLAHITILLFRSRTVLDSGAFCGSNASGNPAKLNNLQCGMVAVWLHYIYLVHFSFLFMEALHNYTLYTYVFVLKPMLTRGIYLLICLLAPLPIVILTAAIWFNDYITQSTCWLNFNSPNFFVELIPALILCVIGTITAEATGMVEYMRNILAQEEKLFSANANSKGSIFIIPVSLFAWIFGMAAVFSTNLSLYTVVAALNIILGILILLFHTLGNAQARWFLWKIFCSWCPKQKPRAKPTTHLPQKYLNRMKPLPTNSEESDANNSSSAMISSANAIQYERKSSLIALVEDAHRRVNQLPRTSDPSPNQKTIDGQTRKSSLIAIVEDAEVRAKQ